MTHRASILVIPAAGLGTRMKAVDPETPKEMLPLAGKPAIQFAVEEGIAAGIRKIVTVISPQKETIRRYFEEPTFAQRLFPGARRGVEKIRRKSDIVFLYQERPVGESDALGLARHLAEDHTVAVYYPDQLHVPFPGALRTMVDAYEACGEDMQGLIDATTDTARTQGNYWRVPPAPVEGHDGVHQIARIYPKRRGLFSPRFAGELKTCAGFVSGPHLFDYIERARKRIGEEEFSIAPVFRLLMAERTMFGCRLPGLIYDLGEPDGYRKCIAALAT